MIDRGSGTIVNITSGAGSHDPPAAAGKGGWGLGYAISKGAMHRIAGILSLELAQRGIRLWNVQPGFVATERMAQDMGSFGFDASAGAPPDVLGAVVVWLLAHPDEG
jgi:NAD(P)-dependent dehydrogenase (short-subunit alcohol dehydrogenase family)